MEEKTTEDAEEVDLNDADEANTDGLKDEEANEYVSKSN